MTQTQKTMKAKDIKDILSGKKKLIDVWYYIQGNYRYYFYYGGKLSGKYKFIAYLRKQVLQQYIKDQIAWRIDNMNRECYYNGECIKCSCQTTHLQMCDKPCEGACYPQMLNRDEWERFKNNSVTSHYKDGEMIGYWGVDVEDGCRLGTKRKMTYHEFEN